MIGGVVVPVGEVADVSSFDFSAPTGLYVEDAVIGADGKEDRSVSLCACCSFFFDGAFYFVGDPGAGDGVFGEDEEELVVMPDGFVEG